LDWVTEDPGFPNENGAARAPMVKTARRERVLMECILVDEKKSENEFGVKLSCRTKAAPVSSSAGGITCLIGASIKTNGA